MNSLLSILKGRDRSAASASASGQSASSSTPGRLSSRELMGIVRKIEHGDEEVTTLALPGLCISNKDFNYLLDAVEQNKVLVTIDVSGNALEDVGVSELLNRIDISGNRKLRSINVSDNGIGREAAKTIEQFLAKHLHVVEMDISGQDLPMLAETGVVSGSDVEIKPISKGQRKRIANLLRSNATVTAFALKKTDRLECVDRGVVVAEGFLPAHWADRMAALDFTDNGILHLPSTLVKFTLLEELLLSGNELSTLPDWLGDLTKLRVIDVSDNKISAIPESLRKLQQLRTLIVTNNAISEIPLALATLPQLSVLSVSGNPVSNLPEEIVARSIHGDDRAITFLREKLAAENSEVYGQVEEARKELKEKEAQLAVVDVAMELEIPSYTELTCSCKVGDSLWFGCATGTILVFDARTLRQRETHTFLDQKVTCMAYVGLPHLQVWVGDATGRIAVYSVRKKTADVDQYSAHTAIRSLAFCKGTDEVWAATAGPTIFPLSAAKPTLEESVDLDGKEIVAMVAVGSEMIVGTSDGFVSILSQEKRAIRAVFQAHSTALSGMIYTGKSLVSAALDGIKVWTKKAKEWDCLYAMHVQEECAPLLAYGNGRLYSTGGRDGSIMLWNSEKQFTLINGIRSPYGQVLSSLAWTPSPDRLWTTSAEGKAYCHEVKRGEKTRKRLEQEKNNPKTTPQGEDKTKDLKEDKKKRLMLSASSTDGAESDEDAAGVIAAVQAPVKEETEESDEEDETDDEYDETGDESKGEARAYPSADVLNEVAAAESVPDVVPSEVLDGLEDDVASLKVALETDEDVVDSENLDVKAVDRPTEVAEPEGGGVSTQEEISTQEEMGSARSVGDTHSTSENEVAEKESSADKKSLSHSVAEGEVDKSQESKAKTMESEVEESESS